MCVFSSISKSFSPSLSFGVEQGVWLQDEVGSHWKNVGALADSKCVGARETCCLATTAPLSSGCDGDVLHIAYAWVCKVLAPQLCHACLMRCVLGRECMCVCVCVCVCVCSCMTVCTVFAYVHACLCMLMCLRVFVREGEREREREGERERERDRVVKGGAGRRSTTHSAGLPPPWLTPQDSASNYLNIYPSVLGRRSKH